MTTSAIVIADTQSPAGKRITTLQLRYPRFIHPEFMTHRVFSRNASSSRAIPVERLIEDVLRDTAMPLHWGKNQPGMQARKEHDAPVLLDGTFVSNENAWLAARDHAIEVARAFTKAGYHKQLVNRLLEPFAHINVVVTSTEWDNFFKLRIHEDAQPEIFNLAAEMKLAMDNSRPENRYWHMPYATGETDPKVSAARCARVSYLTHEGKPPNREADLALAERLLADHHLSPFEHQAHWLPNPEYASGNFRGWQQFRQTL